MREIKQNISSAGSAWATTSYKPKSGLWSYQEVFSKIEKRSTVLEIGCGEGYAAIELALSGHQVTGLDINASSIKLARAKAKQSNVQNNALFQEFDASLDEWPKERFDIVIMQRFLTCIPNDANWQHVVESAKRSLNSDGMLFVRDFALTPETYKERYELGEALGVSYGKFLVQHTPQSRKFFVRHHSDKDISVIHKNLELVWLKFAESHSMNGNRVQTFKLLARSSNP